MDKIKILIVEDEAITAESLANVLNQLGYGVSGIAANALEAIDILNEEDTDMAILDINIQGAKDGIWVAKLIQKKYNMPFVFLTAFEDEKILSKAITTEPYGYLIKPFTNIDISAAVQLALQNFAMNKKVSSTEDILSEKSPDSIRVYNAIFIKEDHIFKKLLINKIIMIKSDGHYVELYTKEKKYLIRSKLGDFARMLPEQLFIQTHRSYFVNINKIEKFGATFLIVNGEEIPLSTAFRTTFNDRVNTL